MQQSEGRDLYQSRCVLNANYSQHVLQANAGTRLADLGLKRGESAGEKELVADGDYIRVPFRLLSAVYLRLYSLFDFTNEAVLRAATSFFDGKPVYKDHDRRVGNAIGHVENPTWDPRDGATPAGINGIYVINKKLFPTISTLIEDKSLYSTSMTCELRHVPSHTFKNPDEFWMNMGRESEDDGEVIRLIVTKIVDFHETSLVWQGADAFAKQIDRKTGKLINPQRTDNAWDRYGQDVSSDNIYAKKQNQFIYLPSYHSSGYLTNKEMEEKKETASTAQAAAGAEKKGQVEAAGSTEPQKAAGDHTAAAAQPNEVTAKAQAVSPEEIKKAREAVEMGIAQASAQVGTGRFYLGKDGVQELKANQIDERNAILVDKEYGAQLHATATQLGEQRDRLSLIMALYPGETLDGKMDYITAAIKERDEILSDARDECLRLYGVHTDGKPNEAVVSLIKTSDWKGVMGLTNDYGGAVGNKFTGYCKTCDGGDVVFGSRSEKKDTESPYEIKAEYRDDAIFIADANRRAQIDYHDKGNKNQEADKK